MTSSNPVPKQKSKLIGTLLAVFLGPFGLFYSTIFGGVFMLCFSVFLVPISYGAAIVSWPIICGIWAFLALHKPRKNPDKPLKAALKGLLFGLLSGVFTVIIIWNAMRGFLE